MTNKRFSEVFGQPVRAANAEITQFHMDVACSIQKVTEEVMMRIVKDIKMEYGAGNLCLAGGVVLNCVINGKILSEFPFDGLWIQPAAGDAGGALGAAFFVYYQYLNNQRPYTGRDKMRNSLLGPSYGTAEVEKILQARKIKYKKYEEEPFLKIVASYIDQAKVIGWFNGRMEFGPRALGARSIIADSRNPQMQSLINLKIKFRESFRPFAPAVLADELDRYFDLSQKSPYMLLVGQLKSHHWLEPAYKHHARGFELLKQVRSTLPAVTHVDCSARVQTVDSAGNGAFYKLIKAFHQLTECPVIVNTSFNVNDEPIVCSPDDALNCFLKSDLDILAIENIIVDKRNL